VLFYSSLQLYFTIYFFFFSVQKLELIIKERRLRWLGHKRKPGRPRKNWMDIIRRDLKDMDISWDEAEELATDRAEWRQRAAQCT